MHDIDSGREEGWFEIRLIRPEEAAEAAEAERICFPPNEAGKREIVEERAALAGEQFLVAAPVCGTRSSGRQACTTRKGPMS